MNNGLILVDVTSTHNPKIDQNKRFVKMLRINIMLDDKGG